MPHREPAGSTVRLVPADDVTLPPSATHDADAPSTGVITHHWVSDAEWGDIEEIVVYGDAA